MSTPSITTDPTAAFAERIEKLISLDAPARGVIAHLYACARARLGEPLCMRAAHLLHENVKAGQPVFIATGWLDRPHVSRWVAETDGPPGAAALARALHRGLGAVPVILVEEEIVDGMSRVMEASGLRALSVEEALLAAKSSAPIHAGAVLPLPKDPTAAAARARELHERFAPAAVIAIEKGGMNDRGFIHTSRGDDTTEHLAKADFLFKEALSRGIPTIGIGDGGNEIGMGVIADEIRQQIPFGAQAKDAEKGGTAPHTVTDVLVAASISNWGAYGVAACVAYLAGRADVFHDAGVEERLLRVAADASFIDGITGCVDPSADGLASSVHQAFVTVMGATLHQALLRGC